MRKLAGQVEQTTEKQTAVGADSQVEQTTEKVGKNKKKKQKKRKKIEELELTKDQVQAKNDELQMAIDELEAELAARDRADSDDNAVMNAKLVATTESLDAATKNLNASESACDEKNITIGMLQRDIAATNAKLVATTETLKELESSKALIVTQLAKRNVELERLLEHTTQSNRDKIDKLESSKDQVVAELVTSRAKIDELVLSMEQVMAKNEELQLAFDQADHKINCCSVSF
jgi:chromosome segregation ATPase